MKMLKKDVVAALAAAGQRTDGSRAELRLRLVESMRAKRAGSGGEQIGGDGGGSGDGGGIVSGGGGERGGGRGDPGREAPRGRAGRAGRAAGRGRGRRGAGVARGRPDLDDNDFSSGHGSGRGRGRGGRGAAGAAVHASVRAETPLGSLGKPGMVAGLGPTHAKRLEQACSALGYDAPTRTAGWLAQLEESVLEAVHVQWGRMLVGKQKQLKLEELKAMQQTIRLHLGGGGDGSGGGGEGFG